MPRFQVLLFSLLLICRLSNAQVAPAKLSAIAIRGEVHRSERFEQEIGGGLVLRLVPDDNGWEIQVGPKDNDEDYMRCVNPPLHGITPYQIEGWHFRNDDNTAPLKPSEDLTPGIGQKREFQFVLTAADQAKSCADLDKMLYDYDQDSPEQLAAIKRFGQYAKGQGAFTITTMTLGNLKPGEQAWIEKMTLTATFSSPVATADHSTPKSK